MDSVYMKITKDKYELPVAVADTAPELAILCGCSVDVIHSVVSKQKKGIIKRGLYVKVDLQD